MGWGFIGDAWDAIGDGLQAAGNGIVGAGKFLTGDTEGAKESFGEAGENLADMGRDGLDAIGGAAEFSLAPGLYVAKEASGYLDDLWGALEGLGERVQGWLDGLLSPLSWVFDKVKSVFSGIWDTAKSFVEKAKEILRGINAPETLQQAAQKWRDGPGKAASAMIPTINQRSEIAKTGWTDEAGKAYAARVPAQVKAVAATQGLCTKAADSLDETAKALLAFYTDCGGLVGRVYAATHGSPGSLFSLDGLMSIFNGGLNNLFTVLKGMIEFAQETQRIQQQLADAVTSSEAFPDGRWPTAVSA